MTKARTPTVNVKRTPQKSSITQRLWTDGLTRNINQTGVVKPVNGIPTFPLKSETSSVMTNQQIGELIHHFTTSLDNVARLLRLFQIKME